MNMGIWPGFGIANAFYAILVPVLNKVESKIAKEKMRKKEGLGR